MRKFICAVGIAASMSGTGNPQPYPSHPITLAMPFAAGGPGDTLARILAEHMKDSLGQTVVVENVTGAAGSIGARRGERCPTTLYAASSNLLPGEGCSHPLALVPQGPICTAIQDCMFWLLLAPHREQEVETGGQHGRKQLPPVQDRYRYRH